MKLKYKVRQTKSGKWAVWANKTQFFSATTYDTEAEAVEASLLRECHELVEKLDNLQARLVSTGNPQYSGRDSHGWRA